MTSLVPGQDGIPDALVELAWAALNASNTWTPFTKKAAYNWLATHPDLVAALHPGETGTEWGVRRERKGDSGPYTHEDATYQFERDQQYPGLFGKVELITRTGPTSWRPVVSLADTEKEQRGESMSDNITTLTDTTLGGKHYESIWVDGKGGTVHIGVRVGKKFLPVVCDDPEAVVFIDGVQVSPVTCEPL